MSDILIDEVAAVSASFHRLLTRPDMSAACAVVIIESIAAPCMAALAMLLKLDPQAIEARIPHVKSRMDAALDAKVH